MPNAEILPFESRPLTATDQAFKALSGAPDIYRIVIEHDIGRCGHCNHVVGTVERQLLRTGEIIMYHRNKFRCRSCNASLIWEPRKF